MQTRYAAARATVAQYTRPVKIPKNTFSPYGDSDEDSDGPPPSPKKTDVTEMKIDKSSLHIFIEALPHLEPLHYGFKLQALNLKGYCFCALVKCLFPWRKKHYVDNDYSVCGARPPTAKAPPLSLFFYASYSPLPSKQTIDSERKLDGSRPAYCVGERRCHDLVVPLLSPWRERGQSRLG